MSKIAEIRTLFEAKIKDGIPDPPGEFDARDLGRVSSDKYLYRVLEHSRNNVQQAVEMLYEIMVWRKKMNANEINENTVNLDYLKEGIFFPQGRDIDSCLLFIMKSKLYHKGQKNVDEVKKIIIYWLERIEREEDGKKITLFFDMDGCGLNNMDIEIIMYMVTLLKNYYPNLINYIIIFQLPWMLSAGFKIVKGILPAEAIERLRTVNKDKLKELVAPEQALVSWGGKNEYVFNFFPENRISVDNTSKSSTLDSQHSLGEMLSLNPGKLLIFKVENDRICAQLTITNMDDSVISFKIRTTAPEKYVVKPSSGILTSKASQTIQIQVNSGFQINSVEKDRFLVVSMQIPSADISAKEISEIWKTIGCKADEYRLKCSTVNMLKSEPIQEKPSHEHDSIMYKLNNLQNNHKMLVKNIKTLRMYQYATLFLTFLSLSLCYVTYNKDCQL
ncbi:motile sperm domain-containing protein 2-like [Danaus plexippus]|uniref:motile sperm domain-containing protein 2-like n=1 Tax=Danaus plexippus TaxID=13037 RepID=UPI002AB0657F|nr:motile sperm domain-containing protein 2-like [Danaus plexippus]